MLFFIAKSHVSVPFFGRMEWNLLWIIRHVRHVHQKLVKFRCQICGKGYHDRRNYHDHMATHAGVKRNVCTICQTQFTFKRGLKAHVMHFHPDEIASLNHNS